MTGCLSLTNTETTKEKKREMGRDLMLGQFLFNNGSLEFYIVIAFHMAALGGLSVPHQIPMNLDSGSQGKVCPPG